MPLLSTLAVVGIVGLASFVRSAVGFGMGLIAMPLLGLVLDIPVATPMLALTGMAMSILIIGQDWRQVEWKSLRFLLAGALPGIPLGILLLKRLPAGPIRIVLGVIVILFALHGLLGKRRLPIGRSPAAAAVLGFASGSLSSGFNIGGPPLVAYASLQGWDPPVFRATLQGFFCSAGIAALGGHAIAGMWTQHVFTLAAGSAVKKLYWVNC